MNRKTNISVQNNVGRYINPNIIVDDKYRGYQSGDILDANSVQHKIEDIIGLVPEEFDTLQEIVDELQKKLDIIQDLSTIRSGAAKGDTAYQKPSDGIPSTDMTTAVLTSLAKAEAAAPQSNVYTKSETDALLDSKANKDGYYESMGVGTANNLRGSDVTQGTFLRRTAGGSADIASGNAYIERIQGNEVVWNQNFNAATPIAISIDNSEGSSAKTETCFASSYIRPANHTFYVCANFIGTASTNVLLYAGNISGATPNLLNSAQILSATNVESQSNVSIVVRVPAGSSIVGTIQPMCIDLTLAGYPNIDTTTPTVAEVEAWLAQMVGTKDYYPYDAGTLLPMNMLGIKTVGFNQWDEEWEKGSILITTGENTVSATKIRSKNFIRVLPSTDYHIYVGSSGISSDYIYFYDANKVFLSVKGFSHGSGWNGYFTTPQNCTYIRFINHNTTYNHDICINLLWSGIRDGEYEPYWEEETALDVTGITGINPNTNQREIVFPDGMEGVGNAHDDIIISGSTVARKSVYRLKKVDITSANGSTEGTGGALRYLLLTGIKKTGLTAFISNFFVEKKSTVSVNDDGWLISGNVTNDYIYLTIPASVLSGDLTTKSGRETAFWTWWDANNPVIVIELATPIIYTDLQYADGTPFTLPLGYKVDDFGTEEIITPTSTAGEPTSCAPTISLRYGVNAVDTIRRLPQTYISKESMEAFLTTLGSAINGTWTMTWGGSNGKYTYAFTPNAEPEPNNE